MDERPSSSGWGEDRNTLGQHDEAKQHTTAAHAHSDLLTNMPRLPTLNLTNNDACLSADCSAGATGNVEPEI